MKLYRIIIIAVSLLIPAIVSVSCVPPQGKNGSEGQIGLNEETIGNLMNGFQNVSTEFQELSKPKQVQAWVDNLIVKAQPGKDMPQVAVMREGETAKYLYQRTVRKSEYILRDQRYIEPWILIETKEGLMGWVHEGGVKYIGTDLQNLLSPATTTTTTNPNARTRSADPAPVENPAQSRLFIPGRAVGPITVNTTEQEIMGIYGPTNVTRGVIELPEKKDACTIVMGGTPDEIRITWKDEASTKVKAVYFLQPNSRWFSRDGLSVGISLSELTKVNKSPIRFYGFDWNYGGTVSSWKTGKMRPYDKFFYVVLEPSVKGPAIKDFKGNKEIDSNTKGLENLGIYVKRIVVYLD